MSFTDQIRAAIRKSGTSRYRLARDSRGHLHESELSRFMSGRGNLGLGKLDLIADMVGLTAREATIRCWTKYKSARAATSPP